VGDPQNYFLDDSVTCFLVGFLRRGGDAGRADRLPDGSPNGLAGGFLRGLPGGWVRDFDSILPGHTLAGELILPGLDILRDPELLADGLVWGRVFDVWAGSRRAFEVCFQNSDSRGVAARGLAL
jgi:hypothetical protein